MDQTLSPIASKIIIIRNEQVLLDTDLAALYHVETRVLKQAVRRNLDRFPEEFMFKLSTEEWKSLRSQNVILEKGRGKYSKYPPYVFTEQGVAMLSGVLKGPRAAEVNIAIMRTFVYLRRLMDSNRSLARKVEKLELKYDEQFQSVFSVIKKLIQQEQKPRKLIGFKQ
jgi:hypothetical protein